jgi:hypothetical protein
MDSAVKSHVEARQDDLSCAELDSKVESLKPAITAVTDHARLVGQDFIAVERDNDLVNTGIFRARHHVVRKFQPSELRDALAGSPPGAVAGVERVRPRREPPTFVDADESRTASGTSKIDVCGAGAAGDNDCCFPAPIGHAIGGDEIGLRAPFSAASPCAFTAKPRRIKSAPL